MLRPNNVPRARSGGTVTACSPTGVLGLRPIAVGRISACTSGSMRAGPVSHLARIDPERRTGIDLEFAGVESGRLGRAAVQRPPRSRRSAARAACRATRSLLKHLGDLLVVDDRRTRMQAARVVLVDQPWPVVVVVLSAARGGGLHPPRRRERSYRPRGDFNGNRANTQRACTCGLRYPDCTAWRRR